MLITKEEDMSANQAKGSQPLTHELFKDRLKVMRKGMTQTELAEAINAGQSSIVNYEKGRYPQADILRSMADVLGCTTDYLVGKDPEPTHEATDIHKWIGLSNATVEALHEAVEKGRNDYKLFVDLFEYMLSQYKTYEQINPDSPEALPGLIRKSNETSKIMYNLERAFRSTLYASAQKKDWTFSPVDHKEYEDGLERRVKIDKSLAKFGEERIKSEDAKNFYLREAADAFRNVLLDFCNRITTDNPKYYRKAFPIKVIEKNSKE